MSFLIEPFEWEFGARLRGLDLNRKLSLDTKQAIQQAFLKHHLVSIPGQDLTAQNYVEVGRIFGHLEPHVLSRYHHPLHREILMLSTVTEKNGSPRGLADAGTYWHSDVSYKARPSSTTVLFGQEIPASGGDTLFTNLTRAYAEMPEELKRKLEGKRGIHDYAFRNDLLAEEGIRPRLTPEERRETPPVSHPAVRTHPITGRKAIYLNPGFTRCIENLAEKESKALLEEVFSHCLQDKYQLRYQWQKGDVVAWDNAALMHSATTKLLPPGVARTLWRLVVSGEAPF